jgi:hypothetical protein
MYVIAQAMVTPINCRFCWTFSEFDQSLHEYWHYVVSGLIRFLAHFMAATAAAVCIASIVTAGVTTTPTIFLAVLAYWYFIRHIEVRWSRKKAFSKRPDADAVIEWIIDDSLLRVTVGELARSERTWAMIIRCVQVRGGFLVFTIGESFEWLPDSAFACVDDVLRFADLAKQKVSEFVDRR